MSDLRTAAQQALEALMDAQRHNYALKHKETDDLITALKAALAQEQVEPMPSWKPWKPVEWGRGCQACGIGADRRAYGYVCSRHDCPTKITFGGSV